MQKLLHISSNEYPPLTVNHTTKKIWLELATGFEEYHILARSKDNKFHTYVEGNIFLHLVPNFKKSRSFFFTSLYMLKIMKKHKIDIILSQCPLIGGYVASLYSKIMKIPIMVEIHGMEYFRILKSEKFLNKFLSKMILFSLKNATKVRSLSSQMTKMLEEYSIKENVVIIPNRVNKKLFNLPKENNFIENKVKVISVGRFVWEKSYEVAIESIIEMREEYDIELTLIGGGPLLKKYKEISCEKKYIKFINWLPQEEFVPLLNQSDIYIQPSVSEGMPRTILEAMAMRLPIIASDVGAIPGIISNSINGLLIEPKNKSALKKSLELLISDSELRETIAYNGYLDATNKYEWEVVFKKYKDELNSMKF